MDQNQHRCIFSPKGNGQLRRCYCPRLQGNIVLVACSPIIQCQDAEEAEVKAILKGIKLLANSDHHKIILETDCASAVSAVRSREPDRSRL
jgi:hypothetical protein